ncbi:helix-turn-helix domain-containing protein [Nitrosomonas eutropha]|uniref:Helix-turn-helix protein n=1 Tax=Nitrosomonas eutropha TaxID=916 RepID=A0ABX5M6G8_9PROT|nr:helix-turn-helix domain-containing protein [Nitrosomonas eutropha]PXV72360.1 helix-turn-helix protein [Nitrosomonas eutropha]SEJ35987.1 Helix-turn-helix domain-containing protein [Nitrosomonas eutropha]
MTTNKIQRQLILEVLRAGPASTLDLRSKGVMHPAGRLMELRLKGCLIDTHWSWEFDSAGIRHRQGRYVLLSEAL